MRPHIRVLVLTAILALGAGLLARPAAARDYAVDTTADNPALATCDDATPGDCSLRGALTDANARPDSEESTIILPSGNYVLTTVASCSVQTTQFGNVGVNATTLCIAGRITIRGQQNAASVVIDGGSTGRVFLVGSDAPVRIESVTIRNGAQLGGSLFGGGGGINSAGDLTLVDAVVTANFSRGKGGGVYSSGTLHVHRSRISQNTATVGGGGVYSDSFNIPVDATITDTTIADNTSTEAQGGGLFVYGSNDGGTTNIVRCTISGNEAIGNGGGGIMAAGLDQTINIENSTISGNRAGWYYGGGLWNEGGNTAGPSRVNLRNVTVTNNRSQDTTGTRGGAGGIANNEAGIITLANTIVAGNFAPDFAPDCYDGGRSSTLTSEGYNIIGEQGANGDGAGGTHCDLTTADGDQTNVDPQLEPLRDNGGLTETHGTVEGSPAIDGGAPSGCRDTEGNVLTGDQRGEPSPTDGDGDGGARCDSGSYENGGTFGVGDVEPPNGGNVGPVCAVIHGHRFVPGVTVKLTKPGAPDIPGSPVSVSADGTVIATAFDLAGRTPGDYSVTITNPGGASTTRSSAFRVDAGGAPEVWAEMIGPVALRRGRWTRFFFVYGNRGNADALGVPIQIAAAPGVGLKLSFSAGPPPANPDQAITDWSTWRTSVDGRPVTDYTIHSFILPLVPAGFTGALEFRVNLPAGGTDVQPLLVPFNGQPFATADGPDADADPDIDPEYVRAHVDAAIAYTRDVLGVPPPGDVAFLTQYVTDQLERIVKVGIDSWFRNPGNTGGGGAGSAGDPGADGGYAGGDDDSPVRCGDPCIGPDGGISTIVKEGRPVPPIPVGGGGPGCPGECVTGCPSKRKWPGGRQCACPPPTDPLAPFDPNGKFGSSMGTGFVSDLEPLRYMVLFENDPVLATAPAQEVVVTDALDTNLLDLDTFSLGPIAFGERRVFPPSGAQDFFTDVDLRPEQNLIVRIRAMLERATGVVTWRFTSLDPDTGDLPEDALAGFLPPNTLPPAGDGGVAFSVKAKPLLPSGTQICNDADIVFDTNPAIVTPQWCNGIDRDKPQSAVAALPATSTTTQIPLAWSGTDVGSRIVEYQVFVSDNGGPYGLLVPATLETQSTFTGVPGHTYAFHAVARDDAGNVEDAPLVADATTRVDLCPADPAKDEPGACGCGVAETDSDADGTPDCVDPDVARDLAIVVVRGPKRTTFAQGGSSKLRYTVVLQNRGAGVETIPDAATLASLVQLDLASVTASACSPAPVIALKPPKARLFPMRVKSKARRAVTFDVTVGCAGDPAKGPTHADYAVSARVDRSVLGAPDSHPADDVCPRRVAPPGVVDPYPDGKILDKGCGGRLADGTFGAAVLLDAVVKPPR